MKRFSSFVALALVAGLVALVGSPASAAGPHYVNDSDPNGGGYSAPGTSCDDPGYATLQGAVNAAAAGDTINLCDGTYAETVTIDTPNLTILGQGTGTIVLPPSGTGITLNENADGLSLQAFRINAANVAQHGLQTDPSGTATVDDVSLNDLTISGATQRGIRITGVASGWSLFDMDVNNNTVGMRITGQVYNLDIVDSEFNNNSGMVGSDFIGIGLEAFNESGVLVIDGLSVTNTEFNNNFNQKGLYFEMLSNATFDGIEVVGNGTRVGYNAGAGLDINLKRGDYSNITIMNSTIADNGDAGATFGGGLTIKARDDAPSYNGDPATLDGVWVHHNEVYGNSPDGIRLGEPGKTNLGPTDAHVYRNSITDNDGNGLENASTPETDGTCNWWGDSSGPGGAGSGTGDEVSTNVDFAEWLVSDDLDGDCIGGLSMGRKHTVRDQLETKQAGADEKDAKRIEKAIEHINKSLNPDYWDDATHLDPDQGKKVFDEEKKAVEELTRVKNTNVSTEILEIVDIDRDLAQTAYNEASPGAEKTKAQQELAKGDADAANQKYASAIEHYKKAWEHAIKAG